jgi:hypothetical protein
MIPYHILLRYELIFIYYIYYYYLFSKGRKSEGIEEFKGTALERDNGRNTFSSKILRIEKQNVKF